LEGNVHVWQLANHQYGERLPADHSGAVLLTIQQGDRSMAKLISWDLFGDGAVAAHDVDVSLRDFGLTREDIRAWLIHTSGPRNQSSASVLAGMGPGLCSELVLLRC
jgi:predicted naringenin-chalcone synthase